MPWHNAGQFFWNPLSLHLPHSLQEIAYQPELVSVIEIGHYSFLSQFNRQFCRFLAKGGLGLSYLLLPQESGLGHQPFYAFSGLGDDPVLFCQPLSGDLAVDFLSLLAYSSQFTLIIFE